MEHLNSIPTTGIVLLFAATLFGSLWVGFWAINPIPEPEVRQGRRWRKKEEALKKSLVYRMAYPAIRYIRYLIGDSLLNSPARREKRKRIDQWLQEAGFPGGFEAEEFLALRIFLILSIPIGFSAFCYLFFQNPLLLLNLILGLFAAFFPVLAISSARSRRIFEVNRSLPYAVDLLGLSMKAGLDFNRALGLLVDKKSVTGALGEELKVLQGEIDLGLTRKEAFQNLVHRVPSEPLRTVAAAIIQADQMGTPMSDVMSIQSHVMKIKRTQTAEKLAAEAPIKLLLPIMLTLLVVLMTVFGGLIVKSMTGSIM